MIYIYILFISFIFSDIKDSIRLKLKDLSSYQKNYDLNLLNANDLDKISTDTYLFEGQIDQIKMNSKEYINKPALSTDLVVMETSRGTLKIKLFPEVAPNHCNNFKKLANSGYYDKTYFHRVIPGFMIQGGDILTRDGIRDNDGTGGPGWTVNAEFNDISHKRGILSMARSSDPNSAGSQFFICVADAVHLNGKYTAFGEVIENMYVADHIVNSMTDFSFASRKLVGKIPDNDDPTTYIKLKNPKTRRFMYAKIPNGETAESFKSTMNKSLRSDNPIAQLELIQVRVNPEPKKDAPQE